MEPNGNVSILKPPISPIGESNVGRQSRPGRRWREGFPSVAGQVLADIRPAAAGGKKKS